MTQAALHNETISTEQHLYMAFELSHKEWKLSFGTGPRNPRIVTIPARDLTKLDSEITKAKKRFGLPEDAEVFSCFEAGRDGHWIHRHLEARGVHSLVVDSASIEVARRKKKKKTDRLDVRKLLTMLIRYLSGERDFWSIVRVPSVEDEDERRVHRELLRLQKERGAHSNRINSLLVTQGIVLKVSRNLPKQLESIRLFDGSEIGVNLKQELLRQHDRWLLSDEHIRLIRKEQNLLRKKALVSASATP